MLERIEHGGPHCVDVVLAGAWVEKAMYFSPLGSSFKIGHPARPDLSRGFIA